MAQSYHIFIHSEGGTGQSPTKPKKNDKPTKPKSEDEIVGNIQKVGSFIENPDSLIGMAKSSVKSVIGATAVGAVAVITYQIIKKVASSSIGLYTTITGDVSAQKSLDNFNSVVGMMFSPFSTTMSAISYNIQINNQNQRTKLQQQLLGDSIINQNYNRKV